MRPYRLHAALTAARTFTREAKSIELLTLYEQRINRSLQKNLTLLQQLQATRRDIRKAERQAEMEQARKLLQLSEKRGLPHEPAEVRTGASPLCDSKDLKDLKENGFVFSNDQIPAAIDRDRPHAQAA